MAELIGEPTPEGECSVHVDGVQEVVADKGYHSNEACLVWTSWNCEPTLPSADWAGWSRSIPMKRLVGPFGLTVRNGPG